VVPTGVVSVDITACGGEGGAADDRRPDIGSGGLGGCVAGTLAVTPGQTLNVYVGGRGTASAPGFNGGGNAGVASAGSLCVGGPAGFGGGASDVRVGGTSLAHRVAVAGGGGGSGSDYW
jgi:hypothetical protein